MATTSLLVLAAGMGSRFGGLKQMEPVGPRGETTLEYSIYDALRVGFEEIVFLIGPSIEDEFRELVIARLPKALNYRIAFQELGGSPGRTKPWGTAHALLCARDGIRAPFVVANADDFYGRESFRIVRDFLIAAPPGPLGSPPTWCMAGFALRNTTSENGAVSRGLCSVGPSGRLTSITEHPAIVRADGGFVSRRTKGDALGLKGDEIVSMNFWGFTPEVFALADPIWEDFIARNRGSMAAEFGLPSLVDRLVTSASAVVSVLPTSESWIGLTYRQDLPAAVSRIAALTEAGIYPSPLWRDA